MMVRAFVVVWLAVVWVVLWGELTTANVVNGLLLGTLLVVFFRVRTPERRSVIRPIALVKFLAVFAFRLVEASAIVAWEVVTPRNRINEGIVAVPIESRSELVTAIVADAISLTPGTLTIEADPDQGLLFVHVLHLRDVESVREDVRRFEALAVDAFGGVREERAAETDQPRPGEGGPG